MDGLNKLFADMTAERWSNAACRGYVIWAMENCDFPSADIQRVVAELHEVFDFRAIEEAEQHYYNRCY